YRVDWVCLVDPKDGDVELGRGRIAVLVLEQYADDIDRRPLVVGCDELTHRRLARRDEHDTLVVAHGLVEPEVVLAGGRAEQAREPAVGPETGRQPDGNGGEGMDVRGGFDRHRGGPFVGVGAHVSWDLTGSEVRRGAPIHVRATSWSANGTIANVSSP